MVFRGKVKMHLQLNINNLFNRDIVTTGRLLENGGVRRVYIQDPRQIRFTTGFDF
jgi:hypothetical protein